MESNKMSNENLNVNVSVETALIEDFAPEMAISAKKHTLKAAYGREKRPLVFACGSDDVLRIFMNDESQQTRWSQFELTKEGEKVTAFDVIQDQASGLISIAVASSTQDNKSRLRFARAVAPEKINSDIAKNDYFFDQPNLLDASATINKIILDKQGALFASIKNDEDAKYYRIFDGKVTKYELPEHGIEVKDLSLGTYKKRNGVFLLYNTKGSQTLLFQSFPSAEGGNTITERFDCGNDSMNSIAVLPNPGSDILFVGGDSLYSFYWQPGQRSPFRKKISDVYSGRKILQIKAAQDSKVQSLIVDYEAPSQTRYLAELSRQRNDENAEWPSDWSTPVIIRAKVSNFAPLSSSVSVFDRDLFCISQTEELIQLRHDATSNFWTEHFVPIKVLDRVRKFYSFNATVKFQFPDRTSSEARTVKLTASRTVSVNANGIDYLVGQKKSAEIELDSNNGLNIIQEADNILSTLFYIEAKFIQSKKTIDLAELLCKKLRELKKASNFYEHPEWSEVVKKNTNLNERALNNVADAIQHILNLREQLVIAKENNYAPEVTAEESNYAPEIAAGVTGVGTAGAFWVYSLVGKAAVGTGPIGLAVVSVAASTYIIVDIFARAFDEKPLPAYIEYRLEKFGNASCLIIRIGETFVRYPIKTPDEAITAIQIILPSIGLIIPVLLKTVSKRKRETTLKMNMFLDEDRDGIVDKTEAKEQVWQWGKGKFGAIVAVPIIKDGETIRENIVLKWVGEKGEKSLDEWTATITVNNKAKIRIYDENNNPITLEIPSQNGNSEIYNLKTSNHFIGVVNGSATRQRFKGAYMFQMEAVKFPEGEEEDPGLVNMTFEFCYKEEKIEQKVQVRIAPWIMASDLAPTAVVEIYHRNDTTHIFKEIVSFLHNRNQNSNNKIQFFANKNSANYRPFHRDESRAGYICTAKFTAINRLSNLRSPLVYFQNLQFTTKESSLDEVERKILGEKYNEIKLTNGSEEKSINFGGNYLVSPPIENYPLGRIVIGSSSIKKQEEVNDLVPFLSAQKIQAPIVVDTTWLNVKHIDEIISFVPIINQSTPKWPYKVLIASPRLGCVFSLISVQYSQYTKEVIAKILEIANEMNMEKLTTELKNHYYLKPNIPQPQIKISIPRNIYESNPEPQNQFVGRTVLWSEESKPNHYLTLDPLWLLKGQNLDEAINQAFKTAQENIDKVRETLKRELNIQDEDFLEIPVIFSIPPAKAITPNSVNMLVINNTGNSCSCLVPKPFGPVVQTSNSENTSQHYLFEADIEQKLKCLGLNVQFVNNWDEYHSRDGQIHCGTNQFPYLSEGKENQLKWWEMSEPK